MSDRDTAQQPDRRNLAAEARAQASMLQSKWEKFGGHSPARTNELLRGLADELDRRAPVPERTEAGVWHTAALIDFGVDFAEWWCRETKRYGEAAAWVDRWVAARLAPGETETEEKP